jgi:Ni/Fe-hydrogenase subunit HybB-like protein
MSHPKPVSKTVFTPGMFVLLLFVLMTGALLLLRFFKGLDAATNLNQSNPWGIWNWFKTAAIVMAASGFMTAALAHVFHREKYHEITRPALLWAVLGYTFAGFMVVVDIGRYYNIWHIFMPSCFQGNSALFEVGWCVVLYLNVLYIEFVPIVTERFLGKVNMPGPLAKLNPLAELLLSIADKTLNLVISVFVIGGVVLSLLHQSSLGVLMAIAQYKVHALWHTGLLPLLFLLSAFAVAFPMTTFVMMTASRAFKRKINFPVLLDLSRYSIFFLIVYLAVTFGNFFVKGNYVYLNDGTFESIMFIVEALIYIAALVMFLMPSVRHTPNGLYKASILVVFGVIFNRFNVFVTSWKLPDAARYYPSIPEALMIIGLFGTIVFLYRLGITIFPVLTDQTSDS